MLATARAEDWPRLGGPGGNGFSSETGLARSWPENGPKVWWSLAVGEGYAGAAIRDGQAFVLDRADDLQDVLRCLELATGRELWRAAMDAPGNLPYNGSRNVPTLDGPWIFAVGPLGQFYCFDGHSRQLAWSRHLVNDFKDPQIDRDTPPADRADQLARVQVPMWGMTQAPLPWRDLVIVAPQTGKTGLVAYEKTTGKLRWQSGSLGRNWYSHVSPFLATLDGVDQVIMLAQPSDPEKSPAQAPPALVTAVDPLTGRILWQTQTPRPYKIPIPQPVQTGASRFLVTGGFGLGCVFFEAARKNGAWEAGVGAENRNASAFIHSPVLYRDHLYVLSLKEHGGAATGLVCLNRAGEIQWQTGPGLQFDQGPLLVVDGLALVLHGKTGVLHLLEISPAGFKLLAKAKVLDGKTPWAPMAFSDGKLLVRDLNRMKCLDLRHP